MINGSNANNTRVQDLFRSVQLNVNNPHFLIMQGRITKVLNMKPPEVFLNKLFVYISLGHFRYSCKNYYEISVRVILDFTVKAVKLSIIPHECVTFLAFKAKNVCPILLFALFYCGHGFDSGLKSQKIAIEIGHFYILNDC